LNALGTNVSRYTLRTNGTYGPHWSNRPYSTDGTYVSCGTLRPYSALSTFRANWTLRSFRTRFTRVQKGIDPKTDVSNRVYEP
jgi:hypothetical protein